MTLAAAGDRLRTDRLCSDGACIEALTAEIPSRSCSSEEMGMMNEWTLQRCASVTWARRNSDCMPYWCCWLTGLVCVAVMDFSFRSLNP